MDKVFLIKYFVVFSLTGSRTEVLFNALADDVDYFVVLSDVKVHYFAGYSNPVKNFVPGICTYGTAEQKKSQFGAGREINIRYPSMAQR